MKVYLDSLKGIYTEGNNLFVIDANVYPITTDSNTYDNGDEFYEVLNSIRECGGMVAIGFGANDLSICYPLNFYVQPGAIRFIVTNVVDGNMLFRCCDIVLSNSVWSGTVTSFYETLT